MRTSAVALTLAACVLAAVPAHAQDKRWEVNGGAGYTLVWGDARKEVGDGFNLAAGFTWYLTDWLGFQAEYSFIRLAQRTISLPVSGTPGGISVPTDFYGQSDGQYGDLNLVLRKKTSRGITPYVVGGVGLYWRSAVIKTPGLGYVAGGCYPYWFYCLPGGLVQVDKVVAGRSTYDMGMDVGGGLTFKVGEKRTFYVEARYHYIWGPTITPDAAAIAAGAPTSVTANGTFLPIVFGVRF